MVVSVLCSFFVWLLAFGLYTAVSVWWLRVFFLFFQHWTWTRENTIRRDEGCLVYNGIHSVLMGPCTAFSDYLRWEFTQVSNSTRLSRPSNALDLPEGTLKCKTLKRLRMIRFFVRYFEFCAAFRV